MTMTMNESYPTNRQTLELDANKKSGAFAPLNHFCTISSFSKNIQGYHTGTMRMNEYRIRTDMVFSLRESI